MIRLTSLARLQFRRLSFTGMKSFLGLGLLVLYVWVIFFAIYFYFGDELLAEVPQEIWVIAPLSMVIPDFMLKLTFVRYNSVMDAFLKSRPIPLAKWKKFLALSHFWDPANLLVPLTLAPVLFLTLPWVSALPLLLILYALSVLNGYLAMRIKRRGSYQSEKQVTASRYSIDGALTSHNARVALQYRSFLRSKRLKTMVLFPTILFMMQFVLHVTGYDHLRTSGHMMLFFSILYPVCALQQFGLGIEARSFSAIWTRPGSISKILCDKYWQGLAFCGAFTLVLLLFCIWFHVPVWAPFSYALFCGGLGGLIYLADAYRCTPFDLFGNTFFNYQGNTGSFKPTVFLGISGMMALFFLVPHFVPSPYSYAIFSVLGLSGIAVHRSIFRLVEKRFLKNRYKYMEKFAEL